MKYYEQSRERYFTVVRSVITWIFTILLLLMVMYLVKEEKEKFSNLLNLNPYHILLLSGICTFLFVPSGFARKLMAKRLGAEISFFDWYKLTMVSNLISMVLPARGDFLFSAVYLKKRYKLPITKFASMVYGSMLLVVIVLSVEGCLGLLLLSLTDNIWDPKILLLLAGSGLGTIPLAFISKNVFRGENWLFRNLRQVFEGWELIRSDSKLLIVLSGLIAIGTLIFTVWMYMSYYILTVEIGIVPVFLAGVIIQLSFLFSITPGNLGVREALLGFVSQILGVGFTEGVAVTLLQRGISILVFAALGGIFGLNIIRSARLSGNEQVKR